MKAGTWFHLKRKRKAYCNYWMGGTLQTMFSEDLFTHQQKTV